MSLSAGARISHDFSHIATMKSLLGSTCAISHLDRNLRASKEKFFCAYRQNFSLREFTAARQMMLTPIIIHFDWRVPKEIYSRQKKCLLIDLTIAEKQIHTCYLLSSNAPTILLHRKGFAASKCTWYKLMAHEQAIWIWSFPTQNRKYICASLLGVTPTNAITR